jgi:hypothetical protein
MRRGAHNGSQDRHGAPIDVDERLLNHQLYDLFADLLVVQMASHCDTGTHSLDEIVGNILPSFVELEETR